MDRKHWELNPRFNLASVSDRGLRHSKNQDFVALESLNNDTYIIVVCDGVSRSQQAELASQIAAHKICLALTNSVTEKIEPQKAMTQAIAIAQKAISELEISRTENSRIETPSTTVVVALVQRSRLTLGWLGDSRAYWISKEGSYLLTKDHSWYNLAVSSGKMTTEAASKHPQAHALTRWLGADQERFHIPSIKTLKLPKQGYLLLCSDGMWNYASRSATLAELLFSSKRKDVLSLSRHLVDFAKSRGGHDNVTVGLLSLDSKP